jgi:hypothetical protein
MSEKPSNDLARMLREHGARYVVGAQGQPIAAILTLEEYEHYLDLLDDEADSQDDELAARLIQAAGRPGRKERQSFRDYLRQRESSRAEVQS